MTPDQPRTITIRIDTFAKLYLFGCVVCFLIGLLA